MKTLLFGTLVFRKHLTEFVQRQVAKEVLRLKKDHEKEIATLNQSNDYALELLAVEKDVQIRNLLDQIDQMRNTVKEAEAMRICARVGVAQVEDMVKELRGYTEKVSLSQMYASQEGMALFQRLNSEAASVRKSIKDSKTVKITFKKELSDAKQREAKTSPKVRSEPD